MTIRVLDQARELVARDALEPALLNVVSVVQGVRGDLGNSIFNTALGLSRRHFALQVERVKRKRPPEDLEREANNLADDLLSFIDLVESLWGNLPQPAIAASRSVNVAESPSNTLPDFREAAMVGNPIRRLAWLNQGLQAARAVCKIRTPTAVGTGFLINGGRLITNNHVLPTPTQAVRSVAIFNFEEDLSGRPLEPVPIDLDGSQFETNNAAEIDCTIVALKATEEQLGRWGALELNCGFELQSTSSVSIIQHPEGGYKQIAIAGNIITQADPGSLYYVTSTMPGSSGAPVFDDDWKVIALHQGGGAWSNEQRRFLDNRGIRFSSIAKDAILGGLLG